MVFLESGRWNHQEKPRGFVRNVRAHLSSVLIVRPLRTVVCSSQPCSASLVLDWGRGRVACNQDAKPRMGFAGVKELRVCVKGVSLNYGEGHGNPPSVLTWRIPWTEEPGGLQSMGLPRVRHNRSNLAGRC